MSDYLLAIWAQRDTCKPYTGPGRVGHVVRITTDPHPTVINEFTSGGSLAHSSCGPCSLQSWLLDKTSVRTTVQEIEKLAGTTPTGTSFAGLEHAAQELGQNAMISSATAPGLIMNPGGGYIDPVSMYPAYLAARQGGQDTLLLAVVTPPLPPPYPPTNEDNMNIFQVNPSADPNAKIPVSGLTGASNLNLVAYENTTATVFAYDLAGKPLKEAIITLEGNDPGVRGPVPKYGTVSGLLGLNNTAPVTLVFYPASVPYTVTVH